MNFKVGDVVTRLSHNSDCEFVIYKIKDNIAFLKGKCTRLNADAPLIDLKLSEKRNDLNNNLNFLIICLNFGRLTFSCVFSTRFFLEKYYI